LPITAHSSTIALSWLLKNILVRNNLWKGLTSKCGFTDSLGNPGLLQKEGPVRRNFTAGGDKYYQNEGVVLGILPGGRGILGKKRFAD
jgi:hypothetical protein